MDRRRQRRTPRCGSSAAPELIAHRAGNGASSIGPASVVAHTVEIDVHSFRGRLEVRHSKSIWPTRVLWEPWYIERSGERPALDEVLVAVPPHTGIWLDLKGFTPRFGRRVVDAVASGGFDVERAVTVSSRSWWVLATAHRAGHRTMRSVGSRLQLWAALRLGRPEADGHVVHERMLDAETAARLHRRLPDLVTWGVHDLERARGLVALGVDGIIADDLGLLAALSDELTTLRDQRGTAAPSA